MKNIRKKSWSEILQINNDEIEEVTDEILDKQMKDAPAGTKYSATSDKKTIISINHFYSKS